MTIQITTPEINELPDLTVEDLLTHSMVPGSLKENDKELFRSKWWDYRFMTPFEATIAYIDAFGQEMRKFYARDIDFEKAQHITVVTGQAVRDGLLVNDKKAKQSFSSFWRGRQVADALGMPYKTYVYEAINNRLRYWTDVKIQDKKGRWHTKMPTAAQVYGENNVERVAARWEELQASMIHYAEHHAFLAQNYEAAPIQNEYFAHLIARARKTMDFTATLVEMIETDHLPVEFAIANLDTKTFETVRHALR